MSLPGFSIQRKVAMCCFILLFVIIGINSYRKIKKEALPKMNVPYVAIQTIYPGASPEEVEIDVAKKIEDAVATVEGLKKQTSICMENVCVNSLEFVTGTDPDIKIHEVREKLNGIISNLPPSVETPILQKININALPVVTMFLTGKQTIDELYDYVDEKLAPRFANLPGVGEVRIHGGDKLELHIGLNRDKLAAANLTVGEVIARLSAANLKLPAGQIGEFGHEISVSYDSEFKSIEDIKNLDVSAKPDTHIYLGDVADVKLASKRIRSIGYFNDIPGIQFEVVKKNDGNTVDVVAVTRKVFEEILEEGIPGGMELHWFFDDSTFVEASLNDSWENVVVGILLTAFLLFIFLHNPRTTLIVSVTMPVTLAIAVGGIYFAGYSFDMISLIALGSATGVLVTNSIVVMENILLRLSRGNDVKTASVEGTNEVVIAVAASALTNIVVFLPVTQMQSIIGNFVKPFGITMVVVTAASLFISFTFTPILANAFLKKDNEIKNPVLKAFSNVWNSVYGKFDGLCQKSFTIVRRLPGTTAFILCAGSIAALVLVAPYLHLDFLPANDQNKISVVLEFPSDISLEGTCQRVEEILRMIKGHKEIDSLGTTIGYVNAMPGKVSMGINMAEITVKLIDKDKRMSHRSFANVLRKDLDTFSDYIYSINIPNPAGMSGMDISAYISGPDSSVLQQYVRKAAKLLQERSMVREIDLTMRNPKPRISLIPDRTIIKNMGANELALGTTVMGFFDGLKIGSYKSGTRTFDIRLKTNDIKNINEANNTAIGSVNGIPINLDAVVTSAADPVSLSIARNNRERSEYIYCNCNTEAGYAVGDIMNVLKDEIAPELPAGYKLTFGPPVDSMDEAVGEFAEVFFSAIVLLYLLMAAVMESWSRPFLIMFTLPLGFIGMFAASAISGVPISMISLLGGVMMIGIVVNNAILIMDEVTILRNEGMGAHDAMTEALKLKLRPIIMTTIASIAGMLPMAFGNGIGSEFRQSCGIGVVGGLLLSAILTVYLIPALYFKFFSGENNRI